MGFLLSRCTLCGRETQQRCTYCEKPVCQRCQTMHKGKVYCTPRHRDMDAGIGHLIRHFNRSLEQSAY